MTEILWGPLSEADYQTDYESGKNFLGASWIENRRRELEEIGNIASLHHGKQTLIRYYEAAHQLAESSTSFTGLNSLQKQMALRFFEFGLLVRRLSDTAIINVNGESANASLVDLYRRDLRTTDRPDNYIHELRTANLYLNEGHDIALIHEGSAEDPTPELRLRNTTPSVDVECKRPDPSITSDDSPERIANRITDIFAGVSEKFHNSRVGVVHIDIPPQIQMSKPLRFRLRHEIKGEIVEPDRDSKITCVFLHQLGLINPSKPPRTIIGVSGPDDDSDSLGLDWDLIPHYTEYPDGLSLLGFDVQTAASAHQVWDDALDEDLSADPDGIREVLDRDTWQIEFTCNSKLIFGDKIEQVYSLTEERRLTFGGLSRPRGVIELADAEDGRYQIKIPPEQGEGGRLHIFISLTDDGFSARIMPIDHQATAGVYQSVVQEPVSRI